MVVVQTNRMVELASSVIIVQLVIANGLGNVHCCTHTILIQYGSIFTMELHVRISPMVKQLKHTVYEGRLLARNRELMMPPVLLKH
jgi:hypothetical protein